VVALFEFSSCPMRHTATPRDIVRRRCRLLLGCLRAFEDFSYIRAASRGTAEIASGLG